MSALTGKLPGCPQAQGSDWVRGCLSAASWPFLPVYAARLKTRSGQFVRCAVSRQSVVLPVV